MGNSIGGKRKCAKVMQLDGTSFRVKPPASAADVLRDHPGFQLLESEEVKLLGARARPLAPDEPLRRGRLYFLVALPRRPSGGGGGARNMRRAWSGNLRVGARERLESLKLSRRSTSDLSSLTPAHASASAPTSPLPGGSTPVRLKMKLPRAQVEKLMGESKDAAEAAAKIMELCTAMGNASARRHAGEAAAGDSAEPAVRQDAGLGRRVHAPAATAATAAQDAAAVAHAATHQGDEKPPMASNSPP
ncbi:hypothetical protein PR202_ga02630 [Eleusine coracana subsp. coracana]|uniref:Uncharacterized protein n=1 Tax=Eleusine coracana subsp. coracana TaxID=191504 RepID=A0AAV5BMP7_ELECO|nr:hypothetical protein PR202_ga02630 [Eleusine coracana subsp. coracana]